MTFNPGTLDASGDISTESKQDDVIAELDLIKGFFNVAVDFDSNNPNIQYIGRAEPNTAVTDSTWQIKRVDCTDGTLIQFADGNDNFDNQYSDRENLVYS